MRSGVDVYRGRPLLGSDFPALSPGIVSVGARPGLAKEPVSGHAEVDGATASKRCNDLAGSHRPTNREPSTSDRVMLTAKEKAVVINVTLVVTFGWYLIRGMPIIDVATAYIKVFLIANGALALFAWLIRYDR